MTTRSMKGIRSSASLIESAQFSRSARLDVSEETGGQLYKLSNNLTLDEAFDRIEEEFV